MILEAIKLVVHAVCVVILGTIILVGVATIAKAIEGNQDQTQLVQPPKLPKIDRDAALDFLESGECIGGEIEEAKFTIWICKE